LESSSQAKKSFRPGREILSGTAEINETYAGGYAEGSPGCAPDSKQAMDMAHRYGEWIWRMDMAAEVSDNKIGRIRMKPRDSVCAANLLPFIPDNSELGILSYTSPSSRRGEQEDRLGEIARLPPPSSEKKYNPPNSINS
jgi:hypothetical protein